MKLYSCPLTENRCYKRNRELIPIQGIMVHSTGANNPNIKRYVQPSNDDPNRKELLEVIGKNFLRNDWNNPKVDKCVHAFIGKLADGSIGVVNTLPWDKRGWHAGRGTSGKTANDTYISFEICEDDLSSPDYFKKAYEAAVELVTMLCRTYKLDPMKPGVVICHKEGYYRGIASQHADVLHWWPKFGVDMDDFRKDVDKRLTVWEEDDMTYYKYFEDIPDHYQEAIKKCIDKGGLQGTGDGELNVSEDYCRIMTSLNRMGDL